MSRVLVVARLACALSAVLVVASNGYAQSLTQSGGQPVVDQSKSDATENAAERETLAESIVARQEAAGKALDPAFRAQVKANLASQPIEALTAIQGRGFGLSPAIASPSPSVFGSSAADLVFNPVAPCRIIDTRVAGGPLAAGAQRPFYAAVGNYSSQGGSSTTCGIPFGPTTAIVVNLVAVNAAAAGDLRAFPFGGALPNSSIINYAKVNDLTSGTPLNVANAFILKICDPFVSGCATFDFTIQADAASTQIVADVLGYFASPVATALSCITQTATVAVPTAGQISFPPGLVSPACPAGYTLTGGGNRYGGPVTGFWWWNSHPNGASWVTAGRNESGSTVNVDVFGVCCRIPGH